MFSQEYFLPFCFTTPQDPQGAFLQKKKKITLASGALRIRGERPERGGDYAGVVWPDLGEQKFRRRRRRRQLAKILFPTAEAGLGIEDDKKCRGAPFFLVGFGVFFFF